MRSLLIAVVVLLATACASTRPPTLPPDVSDIPAIPSNFNEPSFWRDNDSAEYQTRIRVLFQSIRIHNGVATIRIDHNASGKSRGVVIKGDLAGAGGRINEWRSFSVSDADWRHLNELALSPRLFQHYPEFWESSNPGEICIDGVAVVLERLNADGYKLSEANVSCAAPTEFVALVQELIRLSRDRSLSTFLE